MAGRERQKTIQGIEYPKDQKSKRSKRLKNLKKLKPAIREWQATIIKYCRIFKGRDAPYYYNERANISLLAVGAWKAGMVALEEYPTNKRIKNNNHSQAETHRCDLYIANDKRQFQIEAKQSWLDASRGEKQLKNQIQKKFREACRAADENTETSARLGCVFFTVWWPKENQKNPLPIKKIVEIITSCEADIWAWIFPSTARRLDSKSKNGKRYYPGILLGMRAGKYSRFE